MVSEIKMSYCQTYITSSSVLHQGKRHTLFHDRFWKSDHDFLTAFHCNFYLGCVVSEITRFYCKSDMTSFCDFSARGRFRQFFMTYSERATMTSWYRSIVTFYLGCIVYEIMRFYCQADMTSSSFLCYGALQAVFHDGFWATMTSW